MTPSFPVRFTVAAFTLLLLPCCSTLPHGDHPKTHTDRGIQEGSARIPVATPNRFGLSINILVPAGGSIESREPKQGGEEFRIKLSEETGSGDLRIRITDRENRLLWEKSYAYNVSSPGGNSITVVMHPKVPFIRVSYDGYKWDHTSELLRIKQSRFKTIVTEDSGFDSAVFAGMKRAGADMSYGYSVEAGEFTENGIRYHCARFKKDNSKSVHPMEQEDAVSYSGTIIMGKNGQLIAE